jgi:hypothetical protein
MPAIIHFSKFVSESVCAISVRRIKGALSCKICAMPERFEDFRLANERFGDCPPPPSAAEGQVQHGFAPVPRLTAQTRVSGGRSNVQRGNPGGESASGPRPAWYNLS